ncbi:MAG: hypothetical protein AAFY03_13400 [Pseudomonadota bacterium]
MICTRADIVRRFRALILVLLASIVALPAATGLAVNLVPGLQTYVICTGDRLIRVTVGPDGTPVETPEVEVTHCITADATAPSGAKPSDWIALTRVFEQIIIPKPPVALHQPRFAVRRLSRAPPQIA